MKRQMLIDASHQEETRVVVLADKRLEEFDFETVAKKQLKGNIYLAKVTRVEPSLQAAFVDYGGNRHGFLPFSEIHPDYYRIPIADREALIAEEAVISAAPAEEEEAGAEEGEAEEAPAESKGRRGRGRRRKPAKESKEAKDGEEAAAEGETAEEVEQVEVETKVDTLGGDDVEDDARRRAKLMRRYKIQEVIKRRQVLLVQVAKEERGNKGAALTTYLSLAGRYCVLMPNTNKGGGISRKIASATDRRRLKGIISELEIPDGMAVIVRTAGSQRSKAEIRRDYDYLLRLWDEIREGTLQSTAPALIYEEANLIKRAIRDLYSRDMDDILVEGDEGYKAAKDFMKSLMPSHARKVHLYKDDAVPLMQRYQVERQLDTMHSMVVQLGSGGYIVINPTEALVAIDVNSGRATRERHIEETALRTNLEAATEIARQLRLRDLAGLIVIDFIDMEESRHNRDVERRLKEAMRHDRARIQLGRISPFGLLELSRQRLRPSLIESSTVACPMCGGSGRVRSTESAALQVLRNLEEEGVRRPGGRLLVRVPMAVALFILNQKRSRLIEIEQRYSFRIDVEQDEALVPPNFELKRFAEEVEQAAAAPAEAEAEEKETTGRDEDRKRRRRRGRRRRDEESPGETAREEDRAADAAEPEEEAAAAGEEGEGEDGRRPRRRRGKRGGRRRSRRQRESADEGEAAAEGAPAEDAGAPDTRPAEEAAEAATVAEAPLEAIAEDAVADSESDAEDTAPRGRGRGRRRKAAPPEAAEAPSAPEEPGEEPEPAAEQSNSAVEVEVVRDEGPLPLPLAAQPQAVEPADEPEMMGHGAAPAEDDGETKPKRRGWWNRLI